MRLSGKGFKRFLSRLAAVAATKSAFARHLMSALEQVSRRGAPQLESEVGGARRLPLLPLPAAQTGRAVATHRAGSFGIGKPATATNIHAATDN